MFDACLLTLFIVLVMDVFITPTGQPWEFWVIEKNDADIGGKKKKTNKNPDPLLDCSSQELSSTLGLSHGLTFWSPILDLPYGTTLDLFFYIYILVLLLKSYNTF